MAKPQEKKQSEKFIWFILAVVISLWLGTLFIVTQQFPIEENASENSISRMWTMRGQFGDLFGSINALFSGFAFAGIIYTIYIQRKELELQKEELRLQREEMAASRNELARQVTIQQAIHSVNIGQIRVAAAQVKIESIKLKADYLGGKGFSIKLVDEIDIISEEIKQIAENLELNQEDGEVNEKPI